MSNDGTFLSQSVQNSHSLLNIPTVNMIHRDTSSVQFYLLYRVAATHHYLVLLEPTLQ